MLSNLCSLTSFFLEMTVQKQSSQPVMFLRSCNMQSFHNSKLKGTVITNFQSRDINHINVYTFLLVQLLD